MKIAQSRITAQGQISVPAEVRRVLGVGPGSILEWDASDGQLRVRRAGTRTTADIHAVLFPEGSPEQVPPVSVTEGIEEYIRGKHARR